MTLSDTEAAFRRIGSRSSSSSSSSKPPPPSPRLVPAVAQKGALATTRVEAPRARGGPILGTLVALGKTEAQRRGAV